MACDGACPKIIFALIPSFVPDYIFKATNDNGGTLLRGKANPRFALLALFLPDSPVDVEMPSRLKCGVHLAIGETRFFFPLSTL